VFHMCLVGLSTTCGVWFRRSCAKRVPHVALWIFSQPVDFLAINLKITWTEKDLKGIENIKRRDKGNG